MGRIFHDKVVMRPMSLNHCAGLLAVAPSQSGLHALGGSQAFKLGVFGSDVGLDQGGGVNGCEQCLAHAADIKAPVDGAFGELDRQR